MDESNITSPNHKSGFVNIIGNPNVGKSTLMNVLVGERMSIITHKPQTTRHRILGIVNGDDHQIIFSDSPGIIEEPKYEMQGAMNSFAFSSTEDADILIFMTDTIEEPYDGDERIINRMKKLSYPIFLVINKIDVNDQAIDIEKSWKNFGLKDLSVFKISAKEKLGIEPLLEAVTDLLPNHPPFYPKDQLTDKPEKFFVSEIIREQILLIYKQEIPYSTEVVITEFIESEKHGAPFVHIRAEIYVMRKTQKSIVIGKGGSSIKQLGIESRKVIEDFLGKRIHLELYVRVKENWRDDKRYLKNFGYLKS